jgi:ribonuclease HII
MKYIVGIDEVGRGPLAGPVTVCVMACDIHIYSMLRQHRGLPKVGKDSKKLSPEAREAYAKVLETLKKDKKIFFSVQHVSNTVIDAKGISFAIRKSIRQGLSVLKLDCDACEVLLDGGLKAPENFKKQKTIIKGDEKEKIIAWASIAAKVSRDALMCKAAKKYPQYGFEVHKGYGTVKHRQAIKKHGISPLHRKTWLKA